MQVRCKDNQFMIRESHGWVALKWSICFVRASVSEDIFRRKSTLGHAATLTYHCKTVALFPLKLSCCTELNVRPCTYKEASLLFISHSPCCQNIHVVGDVCREVSINTERQILYFAWDTSFQFWYTALLQYYAKLCLSVFPNRYWWLKYYFRSFVADGNLSSMSEGFHFPVFNEELPPLGSGNVLIVDSDILMTIISLKVYVNLSLSAEIRVSIQSLPSNEVLHSLLFCCAFHFPFLKALGIGGCLF